MKVKPVRWRRGIIAIALLTPLFTAIVGIASIGGSSMDAQTGQPKLHAAIVNNDKLSFTDPTLADSGLAGRVLVGELVTAKNSGFTWDITNTANAEAGLANGTYAAIVTIPKNFTAAYLSSTTSNPQQATLSVQTDGSQSYIAAILARALAANLQSSVSSALTQTFVDTLLISFTGLSDGLGDIADGAGALNQGLAAMTDLSAQLPGLTGDLASGSRLVGDGIYMLGDALWSLGQYTGQQVTETGQLASDISSLQTYVSGLPDSPSKTQILGELTALQTNADALTLKALAASAAVDAGALAADVIGSGSDAVTEGTQMLSDGMPLFTEGLAGATEGAGLLAEGLSVASDALPKYTPEQIKQLGKVIAEPVKTDLSSRPALPSVITAVSAFVVPIALWLGALVLALVYSPFETRALRSRASTARIVWGASLPPIVMAVLQSVLIILGALVMGVTPVHHLSFFILLVISSISFVLLHQGLAALAGRSAWLASIALLGLQIVAAGVLVPVQYLPGWVSALGSVLPLSQSIQASQEFLTGGAVSAGLGSIFWLVFTALIGLMLTTIAVSRGRKISAPAQA